MQTLSRLRLAAAAAIPILLLTACGGGTNTSTVNPSPAEGGLIQSPPPRTVSVNASDFTGMLGASASGQGLLALATGDATAKTSLKCGVDVYYMQYATVDGAGKATTASGALMVPTGPNGTSLGKRPIILYAHGTETLKSYNMANLLDPVDDRIPMVAAMFAANGYIVVAPNYAGFDSSPLPYHPYLNAAQQSQDMIDALTAARTALASGTLFASAPMDNGKLFITGYSEGGHVAMATHRALQAAGQTVTASAPCSGPYALAAMGDAIVFGDVDFGATGFVPMVFSNFHNSYKGTPGDDIYNLTGNSTDAYEAAWATGIDTLFPGPVAVETMIGNGTYPMATFNSTPPSAAEIAAGIAADSSWMPAAAAPTITAGLTGLFPTITPPTGGPEAALFAIGFAGTGQHLLRNDYRAAYMADALLNPDGVVPTPTATHAPAATPMHPLRKAFARNDLRGWAPTAPMLMVGGHNDPEVFYPINTSTMAALWAKDPYVQTPVDIDPGINFATLGQVAGGAFGADVAKGVVDPAIFAADIMTAVGAALAPTNPAYTVTNALQGAFLQATGQAVATVITPANLSAMISQAVKANAPFTTAQIGPVASAIATAVGTATSTIVLEAYHSDLVAPFAHVAALQFFQQF